MLCLATANAQNLTLNCQDPKERNEAGHYQAGEGMVDLRWKTKENGPFLLQATKPSAPDTFETRYEGMDQSSVLTGLAEGIHKFRVRVVNLDGDPGPWSEVLVAEVHYMPDSRLRLLLILGGLVVMITAGTIIFGHISHQRRNRNA